MTRRPETREWTTRPAEERAAMEAGGWVLHNVTVRPRRDGPAERVVVMWRLLDRQRDLFGGGEASE